MTDLNLQVVETSGFDLLESASLNANLGVSFSKTPYFSKRMMARYIEWTTRHFDKLLIIVADHLEVYNAQVFKGLSYEEACRRTLEVGQQLRIGYRRATPDELSHRVSVRLASEIIEEAECAVLITHIRNLVLNHSEFNRDLRASISQALSDKLAAAPTAGLPLDAAMDTLANYLIEELAIVLYINHRAPIRYPVLVFPHFIPSILSKLYDEPYLSLFAEINRGETFRSLKLVWGPNEDLDAGS